MLYQMSNFKIIYTSDPINVDLIDEQLNENGVKLKEILLTESYTPNPKGHGEYKLSVKANIKSLTELREKTEHIVKICNSINTYATYIFGQPLDTNTRDFFGSTRYLKEMSKVESWSNNYEALHHKITKLENPEQKHFLSSKVKSNTQYAKIPKSPLNDFYTFLSRSSSVNKLIPKLIHFHSQSIKHEFDIRYLILGKALELAREFFPDRCDHKAFRLLPKDLKAEFLNYDKDIHWLFYISNKRIETRHAVDKKNASLHPYMTDEECKTFAHLSDLLINYIVRNEFNLEPIIWKRG